jgi:hypothetical protein
MTVWRVVIGVWALFTTVVTLFCALLVAVAATTRKYET